MRTAAEKIAQRYGVETVNVLTGFKYIGEVIGKLEAQGRAGAAGMQKVADVMKFVIADGSVVIRPSGTEPKLKVYISITAENNELAAQAEEAVRLDLEKRI